MEVPEKGEILVILRLVLIMKKNFVQMAIMKQNIICKMEKE
jgi:hypothetical protein